MITVQKSETLNRKVGILLLIGIFCFPIVFVWLLLRKGYSKQARVIGFGWLLIFFFWLSNRDKPTHNASTNTPVASVPAAPATAPIAEEDPKTKISQYVFVADEKSDYPKLAKKLGASWSRLQSTREASALHVAVNSKCDFVELAEASDKSTKSNIVIFVDCRNGERMYVSESDLKTGGAYEFQSDKVFDRMSAIKICNGTAKSMTAHPELADMHIWTGSSFSANKTTGNAQVLLDFDASNTFGVKGKFTARCVFPANGEVPEITVHAR